jgi:metal iron transporter
MNCPSRTETDPTARDGWNQSPPALAAETTTREDLNGRANRREVGASDTSEIDGRDTDRRKDAANIETPDGEKGVAVQRTEIGPAATEREGNAPSGRSNRGNSRQLEMVRAFGRKLWSVLVKYSKFVGPGFMVAVAYIDPGTWRLPPLMQSNYQPPMKGCMIAIGFAMDTDMKFRRQLRN